MVAQGVLADWLLESFETMTDEQRTARPVSARALSARALTDFIAAEYKGKTDTVIAVEADISPATLSTFKNAGAPKLNKTFKALAKYLKLDAAALFAGRIERTGQPKPKPEPVEDIVSLAESLRGHPNEKQIVSLMKKAKSTGADRKARRK